MSSKRTTYNCSSYLSVCADVPGVQCFPKKIKCYTRCWGLRGFIHGSIHVFSCRIKNENTHDCVGGLWAENTKQYDSCLKGYKWAWELKTIDIVQFSFLLFCVTVIQRFDAWAAEIPFDWFLNHASNLSFTIIQKITQEHTNPKIALWN